MGAAIAFLKLRASKIDIDTREEEARAILLDEIDNFIRDRIVVAGKVIIESTLKRIRQGDVILIYAK